MLWERPHEWWHQQQQDMGSGAPAGAPTIRPTELHTQHRTSRAFSHLPFMLCECCTVCCATLSSTGLLPALPAVSKQPACRTAPKMGRSCCSILSDMRLAYACSCCREAAGPAAPAPAPLSPAASTFASSSACATRRNAGAHLQAAPQSRPPAPHRCRKAHACSMHGTADKVRAGKRGVSRSGRTRRHARGTGAACLALLAVERAGHGVQQADGVQRGVGGAAPPAQVLLRARRPKGMANLAVPQRVQPRGRGSGPWTPPCAKALPALCWPAAAAMGSDPHCRATSPRYILAALLCRTPPALCGAAGQRCQTGRPPCRPHLHVLALAHVLAQHGAHAVQPQMQRVHERRVGNAPAGRPMGGQSGGAKGGGDRRRRGCCAPAACNNAAGACSFDRQPGEGQVLSGGRCARGCGSSGGARVAGAGGPPTTRCWSSGSSWPPARGHPAAPRSACAPWSWSPLQGRGGVRRPTLGGECGSKCIRRAAAASAGPTSALPARSVCATAATLQSCNEAKRNRARR